MNFVEIGARKRLAFTVRGTGPALLLIRPLGGTMASWARFADILAEHTRVIAFDTVGSGFSSRASWHTTTRGLARDAAGLLAAIDVARAHVYGISLGGMIASWLAVDHAACVNRLVLASTLPRGLGVNLRSLPNLARLASCLMLRPEEAERCMATAILDPRFRAKHPRETRRIAHRAELGRPSRQGLLAHLGAVVTHDVQPELANIHADTLVLVGERDPLITLAGQRALLGRIPRASFTSLPDAGHDLSAEAPEAAAQAVLAHLVPI